jgi:SNF2 family DNA or RNA helicase
MNESNFYPYQRFAVEHILKNPAAGLFLEMGLGKTAVALTAVNRLMYEDFEIGKVLVVAPRRVAESVWPEEVEAWDHLRHLRLSLVAGTEKKRLQALQAKADIYVISRDNIAWLVARCGGAFPYDMLIIDELSSFKSHTAIRFRALRAVRPKIRRVVGLTGTPSPNGLADLWSQLYLLDTGERLGKTLTGYRERYFLPDKRNAGVIYSYKLRTAGENDIYRRISDICISMRSADWLQLPPRIDRTVKVKLSDAERAAYDDFERTQILQSLSVPGDPGAAAPEISAVNAAALAGKLQQFANGAVYDSRHIAHEVHATKLEALGEIVEASQNQNILLLYNFNHDMTRIEAKFRDLSPEHINSPDAIGKWRDGQIKLLFGHPASMGHGLNLQAGGDIIVWFGPTWSLELWQQANARLLRQGRTRPVLVIKLVAEGTVDEDIVAALEGKRDSQDALMDAVKSRVEKWTGKARIPESKRAVRENRTAKF